MRFGKRRDQETPDGDSASMAQPEPGAPPAPEPVLEPEPLAPDPPEADAEDVFEGEAVELPYEPPAYEAPAYEPVAAYERAPVFEPPAPHPVESEPAARLADSMPHHEPGLNSGSGGAWPEPAFDLAERPEILVGAAFAGGLMLALIIRRLGH